MPAEITLKKLLEAPKIQKILECWDDPEEWKRFGYLDSLLVKKKERIVNKDNGGYFDFTATKLIKERPKSIYNYSSHLSKDIQRMVKFGILNNEYRELPHKNKLESWYRPSKDYRYSPLKDKQIDIIHNTPVNQVLPREYVTYYFHDKGLTVHDFKSVDYRTLRDIENKVCIARRILLEKVRDRKLSNIWCDKILNHDSIYPVLKLDIWLYLIMENIQYHSGTVFFLTAWRDSKFKIGSLDNVAMKLAENVFHHLKLKKNNINPTTAFEELNNQAEKMRMAILYEYLIPKKYPDITSTELRNIKIDCWESFKARRHYCTKLFEKILNVGWYATEYLAVENAMGSLAENKIITEEEKLAKGFIIDKELQRGVYKKKKIVVEGEDFFTYKPISPRKEKRNKRFNDFLQDIPKKLEEKLLEFSLALGYKNKEMFYSVINEFANVFVMPELPSIEDLLKNVEPSPHQHHQHSDKTSQDSKDDLLDICI